MKSLYIANGDRLEVDWSLVRALTSSKFVTKVMSELESDFLESDWGNQVFSAKKYSGSVEITVKNSFGYDIFTYEKGEINHIHLTNSEITEMYQSI